MRVTSCLRALSTVLLAGACATPSEPPASTAHAGVAAPPPQLASMRPIQPGMAVLPGTRPPVTALPEVVPPGVLKQRVEARLDAGEAPSLLVGDATRAASELPGDAGAQRLLALVLDESGDAAGALLAYRRATALEFHAPSMRRQAALEEAAGDFPSAIATGEALRLHDPDDAGTHLVLAALYEREARWPAAEAAWREVLRLRPGVPSSLRRHADVLEKLGRVKEARAERAAADTLERQEAAARGDDRKLRALPASRR